MVVSNDECFTLYRAETLTFIVTFSRVKQLSIFPVRTLTASIVNYQAVDFACGHVIYKQTFHFLHDKDVV